MPTWVNPNNITKYDLAHAIGRKLHLEPAEVRKVIDAYCTKIAQEVIAGKKVVLCRFGRFEIKKIKPHNTLVCGKRRDVPAMESIKFKPARGYTRKINR